MINSRDLNDLTPDTKAKCMEFQARCARAGCPIIFTSTYRDHESQDALYAQGRTKPGTVVTKARGGESFHNYRVAADYVPVVNGKAIWGNDQLWAQTGKIAVECGLEWGGNWKSFKDMPHVQNTGGKTIKDFQNAKGA